MHRTCSSVVYTPGAAGRSDVPSVPCAPSVPSVSAGRPCCTFGGGLWLRLCERNTTQTLLLLKTLLATVPPTPVPLLSQAPALALVSSALFLRLSLTTLPPSNALPGDNVNFHFLLCRILHVVGGSARCRYRDSRGAKCFRISVEIDNQDAKRRQLPPNKTRWGVLKGPRS